MERMLDTLTFPDHLVAVSGDWHGSYRWVQSVLPSIRRASAEVRTVFHVGDFGLWPAGKFVDSVDYWAKKTDLHLVVTPGNHDDWDQLAAPFAAGVPAQISDHVTFLPRGCRFTVGGRTAVSFGGAASHDRAWRLKQRSKHAIWWPAELATETEVQAAIDGGPADILFTHDVAGTVTPKVAAVISQRSDEDDPDDLEYVARSRAQIDAVRAAVRPRLHFHGHTHVHDLAEVPAPHGPVRTVSLADESKYGNTVLLDLDDLGVRALSFDELRLPRRW
ncbi:MAG: metallophosphoesterase [Actinobacteria bacterium]|nr:metallophosphoesterase [Actinomycetota bacterium]MBU1609495.1 metallophosphoesterase [Actinomycetota bacterium]MBU2315330.1 metallophosphoesterase [Actinomycetota bacterium]MBU2385528.1 metallophosphoesterase [Actinomycetota bacterium]